MTAHSHFLRSLESTLQHHRGTDNILETLGNGVKDWPSRLWQEFDEVMNSSCAERLFTLLLPKLPNRILEFFEPGHFLTFSLANTRRLSDVFREAANPERRRRREVLKKASVGWKQAIFDLFADQQPLNSQEMGLLREIGVGVPPILLNGATRRRLEMSPAQERFAFNNVEWPTHIEGSPLAEPSWLHAADKLLPASIEASPYRSPACSLAWVEAQPETNQATTAKALAVRQLGFLPALLRTKPPYRLTPAQRTRLLNALDKLYDQLVYFRDPSVHFLFPAIRLICSTDETSKDLVKTIYVRRRVHHPTVIRIPVPRFSRATVRDGLRFCEDCEGWFEPDQMDRPAQCRSCHYGGN